MHPRGTVEPTKVTRTSVWIEQEIAIAAYIRAFAKPTLPIIAFKHKSVGLEGLRSLVHLNPTEFENESEILPILRQRLSEWTTNLDTSDIRLQLTSLRRPSVDNHELRRLKVSITNNTNNSMSSYSLQLCLPSRLLDHQSTRYLNEEPRTDGDVRCFRFSEEGYGSVAPDQTRVIHFDYCITCGCKSPDWAAPLVLLDKLVTVTLWANGNKYSVRKTIKELSVESNAP